MERTPSKIRQRKQFPKKNASGRNGSISYNNEDSGWGARGWAFYENEDGNYEKSMEEQSDEPENKQERNEEPTTPLLPGERDGEEMWGDEYPNAPRTPRAYKKYDRRIWKISDVRKILFLTDRRHLMN